MLTEEILHTNNYISLTKVWHKIGFKIKTPLFSI